MPMVKKYNKMKKVMELMHLISNGSLVSIKNLIKVSII